MGKGGGNIIGYKYLFGLHLILCSNPVNILEIRFQDKTAWSGRAQGGKSITVSKLKLFGGEESEGGVSGVIDVLDGKSNQPINDYLAEHLGPLVPAFRHVTSLVFRQFYHGNNPYPKHPKIKVQDAFIARQWLPTLAWFPREVAVRRSEIYIGIDGSTSMNTAGRLLRACTAAATLLRSLKGTKNSVRVHSVSGSVSGSNSRTIYDCDDDDYETLALWVETLPLSGTVFNGMNVANAISSFITDETSPTPTYDPEDNEGWDTILPPDVIAAPVGRRVAYILGDGDVPDGPAAKAALDAIPELERYCVYINEDRNVPADFALLDNTPDDGVPTAVDLEEATRNLLIGFIRWADMNPMHIIRDALLSTVDNVYVNQEIIGDSFAEAAEQLYAEDFGLSFLWRNGSDINEFKNKIEEHIDAAIFMSRKTGKWEVKLIRDDYDVNELPVLDVLEWKDDLTLELLTQLPNKVILNYTKIDDGESKAVTVTDPASISMTGVVRPVKLDLEGIYWPPLAARVALRELNTRCQPKWSGTIVVGSVPADFDLGSAFVVSNPQLGITEPIVCRATEIIYSTGTSRKITIKFIQDKFSLGEIVGVEDDGRRETTQDALDAVNHITQETPYYLLVMDRGQTEVDQLLSEEPTAGTLLLGAARPNSAHTIVNHYLNDGDGNGWLTYAEGTYIPAQTLAAPVSASPTETTIQLTSSLGLQTVRAGTLAQVGDELLRVDSITQVGGDIFITVGRGCLDTIPRSHEVGAVILFFQDAAQIVNEQYLSSEVIRARYLTATRSDNLRLRDATPRSVTMNQRAIRPLRPANLRVNGEYGPLFTAPISIDLTWSHQDRTLQTTNIPDDYLSSNVGPEIGVDYVVNVFLSDENFNDIDILPVITENIGSVNFYSIDPSTIQALVTPETAFARIRVSASRDGVASWRSPSVFVAFDADFVTEVDFIMDDLTTPPAGNAVDFEME